MNVGSNSNGHVACALAAAGIAAACSDRVPNGERGPLATAQQGVLGTSSTPVSPLVNAATGQLGTESIDASFGSWSNPTTGPIEVIHASLLRNNKILADNVPDDGTGMYESFQHSSVLLPLAAYQGAYASTTVMITNGLKYWTKQPFATTCPTGGSGPCWVETWARPTDTVDGVTFPTRRWQAIATLLPTGQVMVTGGVYGGPEGQGVDSTRVRAPEVYGIDAGMLWYNAWFLTNPAQVTRNYHSVALLLPDGRVWTAGSNKNGLGSDCASNVCTDSGGCNGSPDNRERQVEIFAPWYYGHPDRPTVSCPASMSSNGANYVIGIGNASGHDIGKVALVRAGSVTHAFDVDQRLVWLDVMLRSSTTITVKSPYTTGAAPPGDYMLFALRKTGTYGAHIPSVACWTKR